MNLNILNKYITLFGNLHRHPKAGLGYAPHKPILLLALLDEVERGNIAENLVRIRPELVASFCSYWRVLVPAGQWQERMVYPFRYLIQEGFWELTRGGIRLTSKELGDPTSLSQLNLMIDGGRFAADLWDLLQDRAAIHTLRTHLLRTYFDTTQAEVQPQLPDRPIDYEIERLILEAQSRFRPAAVREKADDGYYVRHALFPQVIKSLYRDACAVCRIKVHTDQEGIVEAAHILPFRRFHNDDPRNGIAMCRNHHWGFDAGGFSITEEYRLIVSPRLLQAEGYVTLGMTICLPEKREYAPAPQALAWHREHVYLRSPTCPTSP